MPPKAAIECGKFFWALENDADRLSYDKDRLFHAFDAIYDWVYKYKPKHPVRGIVPSNNCYALPWGWFCPEVHRIVTQYELVYGRTKAVPDSAFNGLEHSRLVPAKDSTGRRWLHCEDGAQVRPDYISLK
jgi:hypothetical protein